MNTKEVQNKYNVSMATLKNWEKLNYIKNINNISDLEIENIIKNKKRKRRNKKNSVENIIPLSYIDDKRIVLIIEHILKLKEKYNIHTNEILHEAILKLLNQLSLAVPDDLQNILGNRTENQEFLANFNKIVIKYNEDNDFLGCLYMSLISVGKKDVNGIFYTPFKVVSKIVQSTTFQSGFKILDPGCRKWEFSYTNI